MTVLGYGFVHFSGVIDYSDDWVSTAALRFVSVRLNVNRASLHLDPICIFSSGAAHRMVEKISKVIQHDAYRMPL